MRRRGRIPNLARSAASGVVAWQLGELALAESKRHVLAESGHDFARHAMTSKALLVLDVGLHLDRGRLEQAREVAESISISDELVLRCVDAMLALTGVETRDDEVELWSELDLLLSTQSGKLAVVMAQAYLERHLSALHRRLRSLSAETADVVANRDCSLVRVDGQWSDLSSNLVTSRLLELLLKADEPLTFERIGSSLYPDEIVTFGALQNRVNVQMSKLRRLGLKPFLRKLPAGFVFEGSSVIGKAAGEADSRTDKNE